MTAAPCPSFLLRGDRLTVERGGRRLLDEVSLVLAPERLITLVGPNGAGKTTLVRVLLGLLSPDHGNVIRHPGLTIGYVPQRFFPPASLPMNVDAFLRLAGSYARSECRAVLDRLAAGHLLHSSLHQLSGGELQRVLLARALLRRPQLLVLDEPAQGLDMHGEKELYALISRLRQEEGCAVFMVSHDLNRVMAATDEVICLERHVCCAGTPECISQHPEYLRLFGPDWEGLGFYRHRHNHHHDLRGNIVPDPDASDRAEKIAPNGIRQDE